MKPRVIFLGIIVLLLEMLLPGLLSAQLRIITIPNGASITIPTGAELCADIFYANNPGYGTLTYPNANSICRAAVYPVELLHFSASLQEGGVLLEWKTAMESNSMGFEVQRKTGGGQPWAVAGFLPGAGISAFPAQYQFLDALDGLPNVGTLYYRLRMIDTDGSFEYSPEVELDLAGSAAAFMLASPYPNPASDVITIPFSLSAESAVAVALFDMRGVRIGGTPETRRYAIGTHALLLNTAGLSTGHYMLEVRADNQTRSTVIRVMHP